MNISSILTFLQTETLGAKTAWFGIMGLAGLLAFLLARKVIIPLIGKIVRSTPNRYDDAVYNHKFFHRLSWLVPVGTIYLINAHLGYFDRFINPGAGVALTIIIAIAFDAALTAFVAVYNTLPVSRRSPIRGYVQVVKLFIYISGLAVIAGIITQKNPMYIISGLGAMTAVLLLVFKDTITSMVSSVQISFYDTVNLGDWIEVPAAGADGEVIDIALHMIQVQNWDKTITTVPINKLTEDSFKNWSGMQRSGGRRIMRSLYLDISSIGFAQAELVESLNKVHLLKDFIATRQAEIAQYNIQHKIDTSSPVNGRRLTNIGLFRAYAFNYLQQHPQVHSGSDFIIMVRQLQPTEKGLPLQIYCFTTDNTWVGYERIQADIFDHLLAVLPQFGLRYFQLPGGHDVQGLIKAPQNNS